MAKYFSCDVDLVCAPSDEGWLSWLLSECDHLDRSNWNYLKTLPLLPYNVASLFPSVANPMEYWNNLDYDQFTPLEESVEALERINHYFPVIFTSHIEGGSHGKSKAKWIKKHYPFQSGIIYTREKNVLCGSVVGHVDDRLSHLKGFEITKRYLFDTKYTQDVECPVMETIYGWDSVNESFVNDLIKMWR